MHFFIPNSIHSCHSYQISQTLHLKHIYCLLSALCLPYASVPCNEVGTITHTYRHFFTFIPNTLLFSTLFSAPMHYTPHSFCVLQSFSSSIYCQLRPEVLKSIHFHKRLPFSPTSIRQTFTYLEHLITLLFLHLLATFCFRILYQTHSSVCTSFLWVIT